MTIRIAILPGTVLTDLSPDDDVYVYCPDARLDRKLRIQSITLRLDREGEVAELEFGLPEETLEGGLLGIWKDAKRLGLIPGGLGARTSEL